MPKERKPRDPDELKKAQERLAAARLAIPAAVAGTREASIEMFASLRDRAISEGQMNAAVMAETNRAKLAGLLQPDDEKTKELDGLSDYQLRQRLVIALKACGIAVGKLQNGANVLDVASLEAIDGDYGASEAKSLE